MLRGERAQRASLMSHDESVLGRAEAYCRRVARPNQPRQGPSRTNAPSPGIRCRRRVPAWHPCHVALPAVLTDVAVESPRPVKGSSRGRLAGLGPVERSRRTPGSQSHVGLQRPLAMTNDLVVCPALVLGAQCQGNTARHQSTSNHPSPNPPSNHPASLLSKLQLVFRLFHSAFPQHAKIPVHYCIVPVCIVAFTRTNPRATLWPTRDPALPPPRHRHRRGRNSRPNPPTQPALALSLSQLHFTTPHPACSEPDQPEHPRSPYPTSSAA